MACAKVILPQDFSYTNVLRSKNEKLLSLLIDKGFPLPDMGEVACQSTEVRNLFKSRGFEYRPQSASSDRPTVTRNCLRRGDFDEAMRIKGNHHFPLPWAMIIRDRFPPEQPIDMAEMKRYLDAASSDTDWIDLIRCYIYGSTTEPLRACVARADRSQLSPDLLRELLIGSLESWRLPVPLYFEKINLFKSLGAQIDTEIITACISPRRGEPPPREVIESLIDDLFVSLSREQKEGAANKIIPYAVAQNIMWVVEKVAKLNEGRLPEGILFGSSSDEMFRLLESLGATGMGEDFSLYGFTTKSGELEAAIGKFILEHPDQLEPIPEEFMEECEYVYSPVHYMATQLRLPILKALLATGWNANLRDPDTKETPIRAVLSLPVSENDCLLQREVALELVSGGAKVTVDDLSSILIEHKVGEYTNGATPDSIYFAFTRFSQHRIDTLTAVARVVPPAVLLSPSPPSAESSSPGKRCPNLLWAACLYRNTTVITSVVSLLNSAASSLSDLESVRGREEQSTATTRTTAAEITTTKTTTAEEAARKKEQARVMMGALVGQRREKDGLTVIEFLTKKGCFDCLNALNSALLL
ncbi:hypothetical protein Pelo_3488 [Pelomyxa schiedti]|nr:hypothetical protein Pelo_3488 [Pelomyxa schiedti]